MNDYSVLYNIEASSAAPTHLRLADMELHGTLLPVPDSTASLTARTIAKGRANLCSS